MRFAQLMKSFLLGVASLFMMAATSTSHTAVTPALSQLRDIHLPQPIHWWPLAMGWYGVFFVFCCLIIGIVASARRYYLNRLPKQQALKLLQSYQQQYQQGQEKSVSAKISELLKRVALVYYPRKEVAGLQGDAWIEFLTKTSNDLDFNTVRFLVVELPFQSKNAQPLKTQSELDRLFNMARIWIKQRRKPCLN